jgi:hypothetical protein
MRSGKRVLAGVAAGALALGALTIASAPAVSAKPSIKPKAGTTAATVNAVRATGLGTASAILTPSATLEFSGGGSFVPVNTTIDLTAAPTATAKFYYGADDTVTLNADDTIPASGALTPGNSVDDTVLDFRVDTAGAYAGQIYNGTDTVTFSFTTAGTPTAMTLTPATQTVLVGGTADFTLTLRDATGKATQPQTVDSVALTRSSTDDTLVLAVPGAAITGLSAAQLASGSADFSLSTSLTVAGVTTVTATPAGTLPATGVTAQTATVTKTGTVASNSVSKLTVTTPSNAFNTNTAVASSTAQVQAPTANVVVTIDDTSAASAGNVVRFAVWSVTAGGLINGGGATAADPVYFDVTTDASKKATLPLTLGGTALNINAQVVVEQVNVRDQATSVPGGAKMTITQTQALVQPNSIVPTPTAALAKLGASTTVTVQVDDSFGADQVGWTVRAYRGSATGTLLSTATTNAQGQATVTVSPASTLVSGQQEVYYYTATPPVGTGTVDSSSTTTVIYTTDGNITSMSVTPATGTTFSNTAPTLTTAPVIFVPDDTAGVVYGQSAGVVTLSTGVDATAPSGMYTTFTPNPNLATVVTATVTEASGLRVSATIPGATTLWSGGSTTATLTGNGSNKFYVWGTKVGTHDIVISSGGINLTGKVKVSNRAQDAYNIAVTPDKANVAKGGFTTLKAKVTDYWGNPVATTVGAVTGSASGEVLLGGNTNVATFTTNAAGEASVTVIAANTAGAGTITFTPTTAGAPPAWAAGYTKPASFTTAPVLTAISLITVGEAPATKSITITGSRTTVSGKSGIAVDGITVGIEDGKTVTPFIRFPGETTFTAGSARPAITNDEVTWQRKTGKRVTVYLELSDDATIKSNRVTIQAN